jgi:hypothetical protein
MDDRPPRLGIPIFGYNFWDPHRKRNSYSIFDSKDSGWNFFSNSAVEKSRNRNSDSEIRNSEKNKRRNSIHLILCAMSIVIGQLIGLTMSNHMDVGTIAGKGNLSA